jgi:hypothetical protein
MDVHILLGLGCPIKGFDIVSTTSRGEDFCPPYNGALPSFAIAPRFDPSPGLHGTISFRLELLAMVNSTDSN